MSVFSHSRIESYETCPKKYEFAYVLKVPRGPSGIEAFMGSRVHDALEWLYGECRACRIPDEDALVGRYSDVWASEWSDDIPIVREGRAAEDYQAIGEKALRAYHHRYAPFDQGVTVGLERRIALRLDDAHEVVGYIDRLTKVADGAWEIHDYKTSASLMTRQQADADRQLALYELAVREMYPEVGEVSLVWHYLAFDQEVRSSRTPEQLADLRGDVLDRIGRIESQTSFPTKVTNLCDWCDFKTICPAWGHEIATAALPPDEFASEPGVALVDRYMALSDEITRLTAQREAIKQAIVDRTASEGLERLVGTEYSVKVFRYESAGLPDASDPRRAELEEVLRDEGLWDRFSQLSSFALSKAISGCDLP
ncbi:MAG TPA: PD-(D/E)XK nuclease family protein, partial [Coriobacteriia bacterium]